MNLREIKDYMVCGHTAGVCSIGGIESMNMNMYNFTGMWKWVTVWKGLS